MKIKSDFHPARFTKKKRRGEAIGKAGKTMQMNAKE
jgi:hypothetical protein